MKLRFNGTQGFILALLIHIVVIGLLFFSIGSENAIKPQTSDAEPKIIDAVVIDHNKIKAEKQKLEDAEKKKLAEQERRKQEARDVEKKRKEEERRLEDLKKQQKELEQKRIAEEQKLKQAEQDRKQQEIQKKAEQEKLKKEAEKKRLEQEAIKKEEEQKRKEEAARLKAEKEAEAQAKKEAEEKRKAEEAQKQRDAEIAAEEAARAKEIAGGFFGKIATQVGRNFNISGFQPGLTCVLEIKMVPGGDVVSVRVVGSSGDERFDRQAEIAAQKASPLPVPDDIKIFNQYFRTIKFRFNPG